MHFTYDKRLKRKLNFEELINAMKQKLRIWRWLDLTIIGRIQIVKTFIIPIFLYRASLICLYEQAASWKTISLNYLQPVGGKLILCCNFDITKLPIRLPTFYEECLNCFAKCSAANYDSIQIPHTVESVSNYFMEQ